MRIARLGLALFAASLVICIFGATLPKAETGQWPRRLVRVITPFGPGTANDISARNFADRLSKHWGQPVAIENRPGADTLVGVGAFVSAQDDHTLLFSTASSVTLTPL